MCYLFIGSQCHQICIVSQIAGRIMPKWSNTYDIVGKNIRSVEDADNVSHNNLYHKNLVYFSIDIFMNYVSKYYLSDASCLKFTYNIYDLKWYFWSSV